MLHPMLLSDARSAFDDPEWLWEVKFDGIRCLAVASGRMVRLFSRRRQEITRQFPEVVCGVAAALDGQSALLDGELVCPARDGRPDFFALRRRLRPVEAGKIARAAALHPACLMAFDLLELGGVLVTSRPLRERKALLAATLPSGPAVQVVPWWPGTAGTDLARQVAARKLEGVVGKRLASLYRPGARSSDWVKVKFWQQSEVTLLGIRRQPFAALVGEPGGPPLGTVALGWKAADVATIMRLLPDLLLCESGGISWLKPYLRCRIRHRLTPDGLLREPSFTGFILPWEQGPGS